MPRDFPYDLVTLIQLVRERACIWDRSLESYKDRVERRTAWEAIFRSLDTAYDELSAEDKRVTVEEQVITKWTNVRDTFLKSLKPRKGKPKRKYLYYDHLVFLTKNLPPDERLNSEDEWQADESITTDYDESPKQSTSHKRRKKSPEYVLPMKRERSRQLSDNDEEFDSSHHAISFVKCDETAEPRLMNEDEAFFASLLPTVVKYTVEERLDFRMEVLAVMKRINDRKQ